MLYYIYIYYFIVADLDKRRAIVHLAAILFVASRVLATIRREARVTYYESIF